MTHPTLKFSYAVLRRDSRGIVVVDEYDDYTQAIHKCHQLTRMAQAHEVKSHFYTKLRVQEVA